MSEELEKIKPKEDGLFLARIGVTWNLIAIEDGEVYGMHKEGKIEDLMNVHTWERLCNLPCENLLEIKKRTIAFIKKSEEFVKGQLLLADKLI